MATGTVIHKCTDIRHPFFDIRRFLEDTYKVQLPAGVACTRVAHCSSIIDAPRSAKADVLYSLNAGKIYIRNDIDALATLLRANQPAEPWHFVSPWRVSSDVANQPVSASTNATVLRALPFLCELLASDSADGHAIGAKLLSECGPMTPFVLEVFLAALLFVPHDNKPASTLLLKRGTFAYTAAVDGVVTAQLGTSEARALDAARHFGMAALPVRGIPTVAWSRKSARLMGPRFLRLGPDLHTLHGKGQPCYCHTETPLHCKLLAGAQSSTVARLAIAAMLRMLEFEGGNADTPKTSIVRWGLYEGNILVVWSLVYHGGQRGKDEQDALVDLWQSQLLYDSMHTLEVARASEDDLLKIETWRGTGALHCTTASLGDLLATPAFGNLVNCALVPDGRMCVLVSDAQGATVPDALTLGKYAAALAGARLALERKRSTHGAAAYFQTLGAQRLCDTAKTLVYNELRQSVDRIQRSMSHGNATGNGLSVQFGKDRLWHTPDYLRLESHISESRPKLERFFADLNDAGERFAIVGNEARIGGGLKLTLDGKFMLHWKEWRAAHNPQQGAGLGSLVMYCKRLASAADALRYIKDWCKSDGSVPPSSAAASAAASHAQPRALDAVSSSSSSTAEYVPVLLERCGTVPVRSLAWAYLSEARGLADMTGALVTNNSSIMTGSHMKYVNHDRTTHYGTALVVVSENRACLQRIILDECGRKRDIPSPKISLGPTKDANGHFCGARVTPLTQDFRFGWLAQLPLAVQKRIEAMCMQRPRTCFVAEGPETALSVAAAVFGRFSALSYCVFGSSHMPNFRPPPHIERVVLCRENDSGAASDAVAEYARQCRQRLRAQCIEVISIWPEEGYCDFNDMHQAVPGSPGAQRIAQRIASLIASHIEATVAKRKRKNHKVGSPVVVKARAAK